MIVLDAGAATAIVRGSAEGKGFEALALEGERVIAPDFFHCEMANVAWRYNAAGLMDAEEARFLMDGALGLVDEYCSESALAREACADEMANVAWRYNAAGLMDAEEARFLMDGALGLVDEYCSESALAREACAESLRWNHPAYDMFYMVLARRTGATLFTLDKKLMRICRDAGVSCVELATLSE